MELKEEAAALIRRIAKEEVAMLGIRVTALALIVLLGAIITLLVIFRVSKLEDRIQILQLQLLQQDEERPFQFAGRKR